MIDNASTLILQNVLRGERRSLLQYAGEAAPWTNVADQQLVGQLQKMIEEEQKVIVSLSDYLRRGGQNMPYVEPFPMGFTAYNFVSFEFLLKKIIEDQRKGVANLEKSVSAIPDLDGKLFVENLLVINQRHLKALEGLVAAPKPAGA
jgi:hypothetical protein